MRVHNAVWIIFVWLIISCSAALGSQKDSQPEEQAKQRQAGKAAAFYLEKEYLTAEGTGQSESEAKDRAIAELGRVFEANVVSETSDAMQSLYQQRGSKKDEMFTQEVQEKVRVSSKMAFAGVQTKDVWFDEAGRMYHALAILNKADTRAAWEDKVKELDNRVLADLEVVSSLKSRFSRFRAFARIEGFWLERTIFASRLRVIDGAAIAPAYDISDIIKKSVGLKSEITLFIEAAGGEADILRDEFAAALTAGGFRIAKSRDSAELLLITKVATRPLELDPAWKYCRAEATATLKDVGTGEDVASVSKFTRAAHLDYMEATRKAVRKVAEDISVELLALFSP